MMRGSGKFGIIQLMKLDPTKMKDWQIAEAAEETLKPAKELVDELGLKEEDYGFYMDLRKYGSVRHAGFGLGFERCVMYLTGMGNIRDVEPFPRTVGNCDL